MSSPGPLNAAPGSAKVEVSGEKSTHTTPARTTTTHLVEPIEVAKFWKNRSRRDAIRLEIRSFEDSLVFDLRQLTTLQDGRLVPTKKGICCSINKLREVSDALNAAVRKAVELGLIGGAP